MTQVQKKTNTSKTTTVVTSNVAKPLTVKQSVYDGLKPETVNQIKEQAKQARSYLDEINTTGIKLGEALSAIKSLAETEGRFKYILQEEGIDMSETWAYGMIAVYDYYQTLDEATKPRFSLLSPSVQKLLAAPSTPPEAKQVIVETAGETGKSPTKEQTENTIKAAKVTRKETGQPAKITTLKDIAKAKKQHGNSTAAKTTVTKPTVSTDNTKEPTKPEVQQPKAPQPTDKDYSPSENGVVLERVHATLLALKKYIGPADKPDVEQLRTDVDALWQLVIAKTGATK